MNPTTPNAEVLRLQYLQAMGITSYYPRLQLPGALPSQACAWPFAEKLQRTGSDAAVVTGRDDDVAAQSAVSAPGQGSSQDSVPRRPDLHRDLAEIPARTPLAPVEASPVPRATAAATAQVPSGEALHFQLLLLHVDADLSVVLQIPALGRPQLQDRQRVLLGNMLRWLGKGLPSEPAPRVFRWPLPGLTLTNTRCEAGASLLHFLEQACVEQPFRHVLMLGEAAAECLDAQQDHNPAQARAWQWIATHSLDELLALPQLKRAAWQALLPLHAALASRRSDT